MTRRRRRIARSGGLLSALAALALALCGAEASGGAGTKASLLLDREAAKPGETVWAGVRLAMPAGWHTYADPPGDTGLGTKIEWTLPKGISAGTIRWPPPKAISEQGLAARVYEGEAILLVPLTIAADAPAGAVEIRAKASWLECMEACVQGEADVKASLSIGSESKPSKDPTVAAALLGYGTSWVSLEGPYMPLPTGRKAPEAPSGGLPLNLLFAFLGGIVLNVMPCVLPILALKALGFVRQGAETAGRRRLLGLVYGFGVLASFLALALVTIAAQRAAGEGGAGASWGMLFQKPAYVASMAALVTLISLNLFGVFDIGLGGRVLDAADRAALREGLPGAFFQGILATALATPCTAPFMAGAIAYALSQPPAVVLATFLSLGLGFAFPYVLLSFRPAWLRFLPKPGAWMERFKVAMGFPMLATALWLLSLAAPQFGKGGAFRVGLLLVAIAAAAWVFGEFVQRGAWRKGLAVALAALLLALGISALFLFRDQIAWRPWSASAVEKARAEKRVVLVDFTADWCWTCQVNKRTSIEIPSVREKLAALKAEAMLADFTAPDPAIAAELKRFNRPGVPLVVVYPRDPAAPPIVLPTVLTPGHVLEALDEAAK
ncbi:MAG: protein-disulfide reductase DsbD domain-containing protein [Planctomycetota bacterium]